MSNQNLRNTVPERRAEFIFGTAAEVLEMMRNLPSKVQVIRPGDAPAPPPDGADPDEMATALQAAKSQPPAAASQSSRLSSKPKPIHAYQ